MRYNTNRPWFKLFLMIREALASNDFAEILYYQQTNLNCYPIVNRIYFTEVIKKMTTRYLTAFHNGISKNKNLDDEGVEKTR